MIYGNVIRIMSAEEVLINVGTRDNVKEGMEFVIYKVDKQTPIIDPQTKEKLGFLETIKGRIVVTNAQEKFSRAKSVPPASNFSKDANRFATQTRPNIPTPVGNLNIDVQKVQKLNENLTVEVGDPIRVFKKPDPCKKL